MPSRVGGSGKRLGLGKRLRCPGWGSKAKAGVLDWIPSPQRKLTWIQRLGGAENNSRCGEVTNKRCVIKPAITGSG